MRKLRRLRPSLTSLTFSGCKELRELPLSIGDLRNLSELRLIQCKSLRALPHTCKEFANRPVFGPFVAPGADEHGARMQQAMKLKCKHIMNPHALERGLGLNSTHK